MEKSELIEKLEKITSEIFENNDKITCLCPFHHEKTPSFAIDLNRNTYTCYGCGKKGKIEDLFNRKQESECFRKVSVFKYERVMGEMHSEKLFECSGIFHQWGIDYEEFETGPGNYSTAIIEIEDGSVMNIPVELVKFKKCDCEAFQSCEMCKI